MRWYRRVEQVHTIVWIKGVPLSGLAEGSGADDFTRRNYQLFTRRDRRWVRQQSSDGKQMAASIAVSRVRRAKEKRQLPRHPNRKRSNCQDGRNWEIGWRKEKCLLNNIQKASHFKAWSAILEKTILALSFPRVMLRMSTRWNGYHQHYNRNRQCAPRQRYQV